MSECAINVVRTDERLKTEGIKRQEKTKCQRRLVWPQIRLVDKQDSCNQTQSDVWKYCIKKRKYNDEFIKFEFIYTGDKDYPKPRCIIIH
jgi:hypothetical protein